jgi:DNA-binding response OmpR family regulator
LCIDAGYFNVGMPDFMKRILLIDDEELLREVILEFLDLEGFRAIGARNGRDGLRLAHEIKPDLIICDIVMPDIDGYEVLTRLKQTQVLSKIPFMFLSARTSEDDLQHGMALGAISYFTKPFKFHELLRAIIAEIGLPNAGRECAD